MKTIHLFQFKDSITREIPFFNEENSLNSLNDLIGYDLINTEKVTEFIITVPDDFLLEETQRDDLLQMCNDGQETIDHYFMTTVDDYNPI